MNRKPVPIDNVDRFASIIHSLVGPFGIDGIPEIMHYIELLTQACDRHIFEASHKLPSSRLVYERKRYIAVFKGRYLQLNDREYSRVITDVDAKVVTNAIKSLQEKGFNVEEYLKWFFEEFLPKNDKFCPPSLRVTGANFVLDRFFYENREVAKERHQEETRKRDILDLIERAKVILRAEVDLGLKEKVKNLLKSFRDSRIILDEFRGGIEAIEAEVKPLLGTKAT